MAIGRVFNMNCVIPWVCNPDFFLFFLAASVKQYFLILTAAFGKLVTDPKLGGQRGHCETHGLQLLVRETTGCHVRPRHVSQSSGALPSPHVRGGFSPSHFRGMLLDPTGKKPHELFRTGKQTKRISWGLALHNKSGRWLFKEHSCVKFNY